MRKTSQPPHLDAAQGSREAHSETYKQVRRASTGTADAAMRQERQQVSGSAREQADVVRMLWISRPFSWVNTAAPFLVGALLGQSLNVWQIAVGVIYFLFPYNLLLYGVNDIFDYESDKNNPRKQSLEGGLAEPQLHRRLAWSIIITNLPFWLYFLLSGNSASITWLLAVVFMALAYSIKGLRFKEIPIIDSLTSSFHFFSPLLFGLAYSQAASWPWPAVMAFAAWGVGSHSLGAIQDIDYDRQGGIASVATKLGIRATTFFSFTAYLVSALITGCYYGWLAAALLSFYALNVAYFIPGLAKRKPQEFRLAWRNFLWLNWIVGFGLTQILLWRLVL